jgi:two-component system OmpR family response regulator
LSAGAWRLCPLSRTLRRMNGPVVPLTPAEFRLMRAFFERPRHVLERSDLLALATEDEVAVDAAEASAGSRGVDLLVSRLRGKLGDDARAPRWIRTVRGRGYRFDVPEA